MSRVFFISSNTAIDPYPVYPLGMAVVAGALAAAGHHVRQYDCLVHGDDPVRVRQEILDFAPEVVAISMRNIDNVDSFSGEAAWYLGQAKRLVGTIREAVDVPIVVGGPALTLMPEEVAAYLLADHAIVGEGETAFPKLLRQLSSGAPAPFILPRSRPLAGNQFSPPLFEQQLVDYYLKQSGMANLQTKRGCPYRCSYCSYPHLEGRTFRVREPRLVVDELELMQRENGVQRVFFTDSIFNDPQGEYLLLVEEMLRRELGMHWVAFFRPQGLGREELALMQRAGLFAMELGTDAAADRTLAGLCKNFTFADVLKVNQACLEQRLPAAHYIMFGGPDEDQATLAEGLDNIDQLGASMVFAFSGVRIHPASPLHQRAIDDGVITEDAPLLKPVYYFSPLLPRAEMEQTIESRFRGQAHRIFPPFVGLQRMAIMRGFGYRGLMWDKLVRFSKR